MGYNTTVVVLNDALSFIADDAEFGARLANAIRRIQNGQTVDVPAHGKRGIHCNAATVIESHHADHTVYVQVGQNCGRCVTPEEDAWLRKAALRSAKLVAKGRFAAATPSVVGSA